jgi:trehalose 6-phosphate synthase/phosphatase
MHPARRPLAGGTGPLLRRLDDMPAPPAPAAEGRVIIVSNRLPVTVRLDGDTPRLEPSCGGLATGLRGVHEQSDGVWIGWPGVAGLSATATRRVDERLDELGAAAVPISAEELAGFYTRYANGTLWPVLHGRTDAAVPAPTDWDTYRAMNLRYAEVVWRHLRPGDQVWVHDYHLMLLPRLLRARRPGARIGFFLHTPFPELDALATLPRAQRAALVDGLLGADVVGFQTSGDAAHFLDAARTVLDRPAWRTTVDGGTHGVHVGVFPIGIDAEAFAARAADPRVEAEAERLRAAGRPLFVGVDRLDYTKGIPERIEAFARLLEAQPELQGSARLFQLAVPSREDVPAYRALRERVEGLVARVNARFARDGWTPVEYVYGSVDPTRLAALYRAADVMLVTPLRDGMNLVAKEFVASRVDDEGVLVLSERAGAAAELRAALLVDPGDVAGLARSYHAALAMSAAERRVRMRRLRAVVHGHDVYRWAGAFLDRLRALEPAIAPGRGRALVTDANAQPEATYR